MDIVSIIVPIYRIKENYLRQCITSIIQQSYESLEILLIDDGSNDACSCICDEYAKKDKRITAIHQKNGGVSSARNTGLNHASGNWICFVDADDYIDKDYIQHLMAYTQNYSLICTGHTKTFQKHFEKHPAFLPEFKYNMDVLGTSWGKLYRRDIIGDERFDTNLSYCEDIEFNLRTFRKADYIYVDMNEYFYRYHKTSAVRQFNENTILTYEKTLDKIYHMPLDSSQMRARDILASTIYRVIAENYIMALDCSYKEKLKQMKMLADSPYFKSALKDADLSLLSKTRQLPILFVRHHHYRLMYLIIYLRKLQYRIYNRGVS